jgi:hypothetical protein
MKKPEWWINLNVFKHNVTGQEFKKEEKRQLIADGKFLLCMSKVPI